MEDSAKSCLNSSRVCRFCLSQAGVMSHIFDNNYNNNLPSLPSKIMSFTRIKLFSDDDLPKVLCHRCLYLAEKAYDFKSQCESSDLMLREYLSAVQASVTKNSSQTDALDTPSDHQDPNLILKLPTFPIRSPLTDQPIKRKRGRPRKEENLIFYSSPENTNNEGISSGPINEVKMVDGIESVVTVVDPRTENMSNSDDEIKRELPEKDAHVNRELDTARSLAIARAKAKKYMGVIFSTDEFSGAKTRRHLCKGCGKTFGHCSDLRKHVLVHTGERPFHCQLCTKTFSRSTNLNKHLKVHSGQKPFKCSKCPKSFASKGDLQRHLVIHSGVKPFSCHQCNQSFSRKDKLTRHVKLHNLQSHQHLAPPHSAHPYGLYEDAPQPNDRSGLDDVKGDYEYPGMMPMEEAGYGGICKEEDEEDASSEDAHVHSHAEFGDNNANVESMVINIDPWTESDGQGEMNESPEDLADASPDHWTVEEAGLQCVFCQRVCTDETKMRLHLSNHMLGRPHKCLQCDKAFTRRRELLRHENVHTGLKPHKCPICSRAFARKDKLARHVKIHNEEKPPKKLFCDLCAVGFYKLDLYEAHMATHSGYPEEPDYAIESEDGNSEDELNESSVPLAQLSTNPSITVISLSKLCN